MGVVCRNCGVEVDDDLVDEAGTCYVCQECTVRLSLRERARRGYRVPAIPAPRPWPAGLGEMAKRILKGVLSDGN